MTWVNSKTKSILKHKPKLKLRADEDRYEIGKWEILVRLYDNGWVSIIIRHRKNNKNNHYDKVIPFTPIVNERVRIPRKLFPKYLIDKFPWIVEQPEVIA